MVYITQDVLYRTGTKWPVRPQGRGNLIGLSQWWIRKWTRKAEQIVFSAEEIIKDCFGASTLSFSVKDSWQ